MAAVRHIECFKVWNFNCWFGSEGQYASSCQMCPVRTVKKKGRTASSCQISSKSLELLLRYGDCSIFPRWRRPPSWICDAYVGTTHEGHLVVFISGWLRGTVGRTPVFDWRTFPVPPVADGWPHVGKPSAIGQPTRPTQPFILTESINRVVSNFIWCVLLASSGELG